MTDWIYRYHLIVADAERQEANESARSVTGNDADLNTYIVPLSADGQAPATHWGCSTAATESIRTGMLQQLSGLQTVSFWRCAADGYALQSTNHGGSQASIGEPFGFDDACAALGLSRIDE